MNPPLQNAFFLLFLYKFIKSKLFVINWFGLRYWLQMFILHLCIIYHGIWNSQSLDVLFGVYTLKFKMATILGGSHHPIFFGGGLCSVPAREYVVCKFQPDTNKNEEKVVKGLVSQRARARQGARARFVKRKGTPLWVHTSWKHWTTLVCDYNQSYWSSR